MKSVTRVVLPLLALMATLTALSGCAEPGCEDEQTPSSDETGGCG